MDAFLLRNQVITNYKAYLKSFQNISDQRIRETVEQSFEEGPFIPEPLVQFNPSFERGESLEDLASMGQINPQLPQIFGEHKLYRHQIESLKLGIRNQIFVLTSGTGSGKSLFV